MAALNKETPDDRNTRRNSIGAPGPLPTGASAGGSSHAGRKARRYSFGLPSTEKSSGEKGNYIPHYLRASTGSCHDLCKYGKHHAPTESKSPFMTHKRAAVNKEKVTAKIVSPLEGKKTIGRSLESKKAEVSKRDFSSNRKVTKKELKTPQRSTPSASLKSSSSAPDIIALSNDALKKIDVGTVKKPGIWPKTTAVKATMTGPVPLKSSVSKVESSIARQNRNPKLVFPLKDQNGTQKAEIKPPVTNKVEKKTSLVVEVESEPKSKSVESEPVPPTTEIKSPRLMELTNLTDSDDSPFSFDKEDEESSSIVPPVSKSSEASSDKEESLITPHVIESSQSHFDKEVLDEEAEYTDDDEDVESSYDGEFSEDESEFTDDEKAFVSDNDKIPRKGRTITTEGKDVEAIKLKFRRGKVIDLQSENDGPRRLKFRRVRVLDGNEDTRSLTIKTLKTKDVDLQSDNCPPHILKFRRARVVEGNEDGQGIARKTFKQKDIPDATTDSTQGSVSVVLKHQDAQEKKDAQGLYNNVIEETASKLVETRKSKVKALVGAFETVISLQDGKPSST